jgi:hypothetical protein
MSHARLTVLETETMVPIATHPRSDRGPNGAGDNSNTAGGWFAASPREAESCPQTLHRRQTKIPVTACFGAYT